MTTFRLHGYGEQDTPIHVDTMDANLFLAKRPEDARHFLVNFLRLASKDAAVYLAGPDLPIPEYLEGRPLVDVTDGFVPGLDFDVEESAKIFCASMEDASPPIPISATTFPTVRLAVAYSCAARVSLSSAIDTMSSFAVAVEKANRCEADGFAKIFDDYMSRIEGHVPSVGKNQRSDVVSKYQAAFDPLLEFVRKWSKWTSLDMDFDWDGGRSDSVAQVVAKRGVVVDRSGDLGGTFRIAGTCKDLVGSMTAVSLHSGSGGGLYGLDPSFSRGEGSFRIGVALVGTISGRHPLKSVLASTKMRNVFVCDDLVLPYRGLADEDPAGWHHFGKGAKGGTSSPYDEAEAQMKRIDFLDKVKAAAVTCDGEAETVLTKEIERSKKALAQVARYIADPDGFETCRDLYHVADTTTRTRTRIRIDPPAP